MHFSKHLFKRMEIKGIEKAFITLHVGLGNFRTVDVEDPAAYHTLDAGLTHNGITELFVNGEPAGVRWYGARTFDVAGKLRKGTNVLTIRVTTVLTNYAKARAADTPTAARWEWAQRLNKELGLRGPVTLY